VAPYHSHDGLQPLKPGVPVELDIEIWPTSVVVPVGYRIALTIRGKDYEHACRGGKLSNFKNELRGCGPFLHNDPTDRPANIFAGRTTLHGEKDQQPYRAAAGHSKENNHRKTAEAKRVLVAQTSVCARFCVGKNQNHTGCATRLCSTRALSAYNARSQKAITRFL